MTTPPPAEQQDAVVRRINATLAGPVVDVLVKLVPEVARLPRADALELILDDIDLLQRCFHAFHTNLAAFRPLLKGADGRPVDDSETPLVCGRTLDEVVAMIVRTAAKRHFRRRLDHDTRRLRRPPRPAPKSATTFERLRALLMGRPTRAIRPQSKGDQVYTAIKDRLRFDWQLPLVPEYTAFRPQTLEKLGDRLLDWRVPDDVRRAHIMPDYPPPPTSVELMEYLGVGVFALPPILPPPPAPVRRPVVTAERRPTQGMAPAPTIETVPQAVDRRAPVDTLLTAGGQRLRPESFSDVLLDPAVTAALPGSGQSFKLGGPLGEVGAETARRIVDALGLSTAQLAVFLLRAHTLLGDRHFSVAFGADGRTDYVERILLRAKKAGIGPDSDLKAITAFLKDLFNTSAARL